MAKKMMMTNPNVPFLHKNIDHAATLNLPLLKPGCHSGEKGVIVCGCGPTLIRPKANLDKIKKLVKVGYKVIAVKEAVRVLTEKGVKVDYAVAMDPDAKQIDKTPIVPGVIYYLASSCHPDMFKHCMDGGAEVRIFHSACGAQNEIPRYHHLFGDTTVAEGGYTVINRAFAVAKIMGFPGPNTYIAGAPFGWRKGQSYYAQGVRGKPGNAVGPEWCDAGKIEGNPAKKWWTKLDLMTSAQDMARRIKAGECKVIGDSLAFALSKHDDAYIESVATKEKVEKKAKAGTKRSRFEVDKASGDVAIVNEVLSAPSLALDADTSDVKLVPPRWVPEAPTQNPGG